MNDIEDLTGEWVTMHGESRTVIGRRADGRWNSFADGTILDWGAPYILRNWTRVPKPEPVNNEPADLAGNAYDYDGKSTRTVIGRIPGSDDTWAVYYETNGQIHPCDGQMIRRWEPPTPKPLPWVEHPDAWWQRVDPDGVTDRINPLLHSSAFNAPDPKAWRRVIGAVPADTHVAIPREIIKNLRDEYYSADWASPAVDSVLDAADGGEPE